MRPVDPQSYRWFLINGQLFVNEGLTIQFIAYAAHAADLPAGELGATEIADRIREQHATNYESPDARWLEVELMEMRPKQAYIGDPLRAKELGQ